MFLVHRTATSLVARPSITYHVDADDLAIALLDLTELGQEVPEPRLGDDGVGREDAHAVQLGRGVGLRGQIAPNDLVLGKTPCDCQCTHSFEFFR